MLVYVLRPLLTRKMTFESFAINQIVYPLSFKTYFDRVNLLKTLYLFYFFNMLFSPDVVTIISCLNSQ